MGSVTARNGDINYDQHFINCMPISNKNAETEEKKLYLKKRGGTEVLYNPSNTVVTGKGIYYWEETNCTYSVQNNTLYAITEEGSFIEVITGSIFYFVSGCGFAEYRADTNGLFVCDGTNAWVVSNTNVATKITSAGFPTPHQPYPVYMDGYIFILDSDGKIYNSDLQDPLTWNGDFITPEMYPDKAVYLSRQLNQIVAVGTYSVEFFYDAAEEVGSPLARTSQATIQTGTHHPKSVNTVDGIIMFVASSRSGGHFVAAIEALRMRPVSDEPINRILQEYKNSLGDQLTFTSSFIRVDGHFLYVLNLRNSTNTSIIYRTLVYDIVEKLWHEWSGLDTLFCTDKQGLPLILDRNGTIYKMTASVFVDKLNSLAQPTGYTIPVTIQTANYDGGGFDRKFCRKISLIGDFYSTDNYMDVSWSDDDYKTWSTARTVNLKERALLTQCGAFRRRAFKLYQNNDKPLRMDFIELDIETGTH